jgi:hypothetical protein
MDDHQALAILTALAHGANPQTGEVFGSESVYQLPEVIRALFVAQRALEAKLATGVATEKSATEKIQRDMSSRDSPLANVPRQTSRDQRDVVKTSKTSKAQSGNIGKPWTADEDAQLLKAFDADQAITEIARTHERTPGGIRARLEKHGRVEPSSATRWPAQRTSPNRTPLP